MKYFCSPLKLIRMLVAIKDKDLVIKHSEIQSKIEDPEWYLSAEGKTAYDNARTPSQKTTYFFYYLMSLQKPINPDIDYRSENAWQREILYKMAYVMAHSMDRSSLEFAGYPNILSPEKNPLVDRAAKRFFFYSDNASYGLMLLAALHREEDHEAYFSEKPHARLHYCGKSGAVSDMYKIERDIIGAFLGDNDQNHISPYLYSMIEE